MITCPKCGVGMNLRNGKYGEFYYCAEHGTISKAKVDVMVAILSRSTPGLPLQSPDPLMDAVKRKGVAMGHHVDELGQTIDWIIDNEASADWDEDSWMNVRPY